MTGLLSGPWLGLLMDSSVKGSLLFALAWLAARAMKRQPAALRHAVWAAAALGALAMPVANYFVPAWHAGVVQKAAAVLTQTPAGEPEASLASMVVNAATQAAPTARGVLLVMWAAGAGAVLLALLAGATRIAWLASRAEPLFVPKWMALSAELSAGLGLSRPVRLLRSRSASMPLTWGALHPRILLPADADSWPQARMRIVLSRARPHKAAGLAGTDGR